MGGPIKKSVIFLTALLITILFFQTVSASDAPTLSNETPANNATDISISISSISVTIINADNDTFNWTIETSPNVGSSSAINASNGSKTCDISGLDHDTTYTWYVNATDDEDNWANGLYHFTTAVKETVTDIEIYPANPKAGTSLAVILKGGYEGENAKGLLYCNDNLYAFDMSNGVGVVALDQQSYGTATLRIFSGAFSPTEITKTITIEQPSTDNIRLLAPSTAIINKETTVMLRFNQKPLPDFEVKVASPDGTDSYLITDENGKIYATLDKAGIWSFKTNVYGRGISAVTSAVYETLILSFIGTPSVGMETVITTEPYASVEIFLDDELIEQYVASPQGTVEFTPATGGFYEVHSTSSSKKGTCYFDVAGTATIRILDALTSFPVVNFEKGKIYQVIVSNNVGIALENIEMLYVTTPFATTELLLLADGKATWMPHLTGSYIFTIEETETQTGASQHIIVREALVEGGDSTVLFISITIIFVLVSVAIIYYAHYKHIPLKNIFKILKFGKKKKASLPFDY